MSPGYNGGMSGKTPRLWTLDELTAQVALALSVGYEGQTSGRVREVPDIRTIRYYTTLGLLDRAAAMRGRTALYGPRHLLQLVAIKRLQAEGLSLSEIQRRLLGISDDALRRIARLPQPPEEENAPSEPSTTRGEFWKSSPAPAVAPTLVGVPLAPGVTLLLSAGRPVDEQDLEALRSAAAPLLKCLTARRLLGPDGEPTTTKGDAG